MMMPLTVPLCRIRADAIFLAQDEDNRGSQASRTIGEMMQSRMDTEHLNGTRHTTSANSDSDYIIDAVNAGGIFLSGG